MIFQEAIDAIIGRHRQRGGEREIRMLVAGQWVEGARESEADSCSEAKIRGLAVPVLRDEHFGPAD